MPWNGSLVQMGIQMRTCTRCSLLIQSWLWETEEMSYLAFHAVQSFQFHSVSEAKLEPRAFLPQCLSSICCLEQRKVAVKLVTCYQSPWIWQCWLFASGRFHLSASINEPWRDLLNYIHFVHSVTAPSRNLSEDIAADSWDSSWWEIVSVVHLVCSRSCHEFMCLWESTELQAAAQKMCTAATSAPSETPRTRHSKKENPSTENAWNADWGRGVKVHKLRSDWVSHHSEQWDLPGLSEERPGGALQRKNTIATTVQFFVSLLLELQPSLGTMTCKCLQK